MRRIPTLLHAVSLKPVLESFILMTSAAFALMLASPSPVQAQARDTTHCCTVVRVDTKRGIVTARETATGYTFSVEVKKRKVISALRIGDKVWADFGAKKVRLEAAGDSLCCAIVETPAGTALDTPSMTYEAMPFHHPHSWS